MRGVKNEPLKLYWVETPDHHEDWFVVARSPEEAQELFEDVEGYDDGGSIAQELRLLPDESQPGEAQASSALALRAAAPHCEKAAGTKGRAYVAPPRTCPWTRQPSTANTSPFNCESSECRGNREFRLQRLVVVLGA